MLHDVLQLMATTPSSEACIQALLQRTQQITGAASAYFLMLVEPHLNVAIGSVPPDETLISLTKTLGAGIHFNPKLSDGHKSEGWLFAPIQIDPLVSLPFNLSAGSGSYPRPGGTGSCTGNNGSGSALARTG
jgi:hypothetical protein